MDWVYVWEVIEKDDKRSNQPIFLRLKELNVDEEHSFFDNSQDRPEQAMLLDVIQPGDCLSVRSIEDLADTTQGLENILEELNDKGVVLYSCEESFLNGTNYLETYISIVWVYTTIQHKQKQTAYRKAVAAGTVGRPTKAKEIEQAVTMYESGNYTIRQIEKITGISKSTLYRYLERGSQ